jgi:hypothetical protein
VALFLCLGAVQAQSVASSAPPEQIDRAARAIEAANEAGAPALAPDSLALADAALADARALLAKRKGKEAERQALRAIRYAELSANQARYIGLKEAVEEKTAYNARLRRELLLGESGQKP